RAGTYVHGGPARYDEHAAQTECAGALATLRHVDRSYPDSLFNWAGLLVVNSRTLATIKYVLIGVIIVLVVMLAGVLVLTRTQWGAERARGYATNWLAAQVHGTVKLGKITSAGLLGGVTIHDFSIVDKKNRPF